MINVYVNKFVEAIKDGGSALRPGKKYKVLEIHPAYIKVRLEKFNHTFDYDNFEYYFGKFKLGHAELNKNVKIL